MYSVFGHFQYRTFDNIGTLDFNEEQLTEIGDSIIFEFYSSNLKIEEQPIKPIKETELFIDLPDEIKQFYKVIKFIGSGTNGIVYEIEHKFFKERKALKQYRQLPTIEDLEYKIVSIIIECSTIIWNSKKKKLQTIPQPSHVLRIEKYDYRYIEDHYKVEMISPLLQMSLLGFIPILKSDSNQRDALLGQIVVQNLKGLKSIHDIELSHNDIKEANILVSYYKPDVYVCLSDFELVDDSASGSISSLFGTKLYLPPETLKKNHKSTKLDIWSLGVTFFNIMCQIWDIDPLATFTDATDVCVTNGFICLGYIPSHELLNQYLNNTFRGYSNHFMTTIIKKLLVFDHLARPTSTAMLEFISKRYGMK
ncbi:predicted protein [Naegleria gruberi]|uniref:Predicted protein n=1 Tax=Naegleria gruberi TaxID=5762 RepID=D2VC28_NAEGR|nr:uncharacterized protein NAEGRDRAFT_66424 [Naegleria gruberi]EFC45674.1 predicted protein [Naegleria gruberi]|eukprot:XP_002678418.1 predicted protein [Naegleria gruberi strain NEG-M]